MRRGVKCSDETKAKIRAARAKQIMPSPSLETRKKMSEWQIGKKHSDETRKKISLAKIGKKQLLSDEQIRVKSLRMKGNTNNLGRKFPNRNPSHPVSKETRLKMSEAHRGDKCYSWKGGISIKNRLIRKGVEAKLWKEAVFKRDNYTCVWCGQYGGKLNADHIKTFALFPELRFDVPNGRTLCFKCHTNSFTWGKLPIVSILIPHIYRDDGLKKCLESIRNINYPKNLVEVITILGNESVPIKIKTGVEQSKGEWIVYAANDMFFEKDCIINGLSVGNKRLIAFNEGTLLPDMGNRCTHFMIKRDLIPLIGGEIFCTRMNHCGVDNLLWAKCEKLGEAYYCVDAKITHNHFSKGGQWDEVYEKGWSKVEEDRKILQEELALL